MRITIIIITTLIALNTKAQIIEKELKTSGSIQVIQTKSIVDTAKHSYAHDAPSSYSSKKPLVIVDGKRKRFDNISQLDPNSVAEVFVMKGKEAILKYGGRARHGVIIITLKKN